MRILMTGATGFLGRRLARRFLIQGHDLVILTRDVEKARASFPYPARFFNWDPLREKPPVEAFEKVDAVAHLAGDPVAESRWSDSKKALIRDSRIAGTRNLMSTISSLGSGAPRVVLSASAIGFYGDRGDELLEEPSSPGKGFLAEVCQGWEQELFSSSSEKVRRVAIRIGVVLGREGGALAKLIPVFRSGLGGAIGSGRQWMSWIHVDDLVSLMVWAISDDRAQGVVNAVAPHPVTNSEFSTELGRAMHRPTVLRTPAAALQLTLGEMSMVVLASQRVSSTRVQAFGFKFEFPNLREALADLSLFDEELRAEQWIPQPVEPLWEFFSKAKNLEEITPPWMGFRVTGMSTPEIENQTLIDYKLKIHGVPVRWQSRIEDWTPPLRFVDTQTHGPYAKWHHTHSFFPVAGGTLAEDRVLYRVPMGALGKVVAGWKVKRDIETIFTYRKKIIQDLFGR